jgi:hypothetical protein
VVSNLFVFGAFLDTPYLNCCELLLVRIGVLANIGCSNY